MTGRVQFPIHLQVCTGSHQNPHGRAARPSSLDFAIGYRNGDCQTRYHVAVSLLAMHVSEGTTGADSVDG